MITPLSLPRRNETWHVYTWQMKAWIRIAEAEPFQPFGILTLNLDKQLAIDAHILDEPFSPDEIFDRLVETMKKRDENLQRKNGRPARIGFEDHHLSSELAERLAEWKIEAFPADHLEIVDHFVEGLEEHLGRGPSSLPGLLSVEGVTPELVAGFFKAAADLYRAEPWERISSDHFFALTVPPETAPRYLSLMGFNGIEYGVSMSRNWEDVERLFRYADSPLDAVPETGANSLFFHAPEDTPMDDVMAADEHGWEVADEEAYPFPVIMLPGEEGGASRPSRDDLAWYEAALQALLVFIDEHLEETGLDEFNPAEADVTVPTHAGRATIHVKFPGGVLPEESFSSGIDDADSVPDLPPIDRRLMERMMPRFSGGAGDPALEEAQELMYDAWEEPDPRRRIALARQALSVSPDCADAYIQLAEDEAGTAGEALEYYRQGVAAGKRALGDEFEELAGHFWMAMETRPYMRAREGYAEVLRSLGKKAEALGEYRAMLDLNPNDNQGIRYRLAGLLLELDQVQEIEELLGRYPDDWSPGFLYTRALLAFRASGPSPEAFGALAEALRQNPHVPAFLTGRKRIPARLADTVLVGGEDEAAEYAAGALPHWRRTRGALEWLKEAGGLDEPAAPRKKKPKRGRRPSKKS